MWPFSLIYLVLLMAPSAGAGIQECQVAFEILGLPAVEEGTPGIPKGVPFPRAVAYKVVNYLNSGQQGNVFRVYPEKGLPYILKQYHREKAYFSEDVSQFREFGKLPQQGDRFQIARITHVNERAGYLTFEDIRGRTVLEAADRVGELSPEGATAIKEIYNRRLQQFARDLEARGWTATKEASSDGYDNYKFKRNNVEAEIAPQNVIYHVETGTMVIIDFG